MAGAESAALGVALEGEGHCFHEGQVEVLKTSTHFFEEVERDRSMAFFMAMGVAGR